jgi:hypothetical protein
MMDFQQIGDVREILSRHNLEIKPCSCLHSTPRFRVSGTPAGSPISQQQQDFQNADTV